MSLKLANLMRPKTWSLVTKLMALYSISTLGILLSVFLFLYPTLTGVLDNISEKYSTYQSQLMGSSFKQEVKKVCVDKVIITLLFSTLGTIVLGNIVARNGLRRIRDLTEAMEKITANSLQQRLDPNDWPKELKYLGNNFNAMLNRIENSFTQLSQFSADIAHELRNPINSLRGMTEVILYSEKSPEAYQQLLESHLEEYSYLSKVIENLLFLARSDHGELTLDKEKLNTRAEINKILEYYQSVIDEKNLNLQFIGNAQINADPLLFKRVISNLLSNAVRYTPNNGDIEIHINSQDTFIEIAIHNSGEGIEAKHLPKIFDRFYCADSARSSQSGGSGLGLAIVKSIMNLHNGSIEIESIKNQNTVVNLTFPIYF